MPNTRPPHPRELGATRFYARVLSFVAECPHCGEVVSVRATNTKPKETAPNAAGFNPRTARWQCARCHKIYVVGLLVWPPPLGLGARGLPDDQVPGPRQLAQLRSDGDGWWLPDDQRDIGRMDMSNLTGEEDRPEVEDALELDLAIHEPDTTPKKRRG